MSGDHVTITGAAGRYASALFELASDAKLADKVEADMAALGELLAGSEELSAALKSPMVDGDAKSGIITAIAEKAGFQDMTRNALKVAAENGRAGEFGLIAAAYAKMAAAARGVVSADVTSAAKLTAKEIDALTASLKRALGREVDVRTHENPDILGGLIVQVGSRMYDSSLRTKLDGLRTAMKEA
ncbi:F0F1 ATP synthase subunit delta [Hyphobacterium sp. CCMP332]|uniref:F0F1 ATP synthase subunit delta n=1 Tax=Hyphobacterium sp. CCMP332 TaxID=2749086 RepID=UPI001650045A|nr:F0F1 ATP synthase subunit delta [Hyphobacterium sp. CCMP332]QNL20144.1 F0F1 ATP synthase subunit delta [Hyphobacterium sp. CCMP332]